MAATGKHTRATIVSRRDHGDDLWSLRLAPSAPFHFVPGQYATIGLEREGGVVERPYSIVSSPHEPELELFLELVPDGSLTPLLHGLAPGAEVLLRPRAKGVFTLDTRSGHTNHLLIATVTGVAPFVSMVRSLLHERASGTLDASRRLLVIEGASRSWEMAYGAELEAAAETLPCVQHVATVSRPWEDPRWDGERGRVEDVLRKHVDARGWGPDDTTVYLCGHPGMIEGARAIMMRAGFRSEHIHEEHYWPPGRGAEGPT